MVFEPFRRLVEVLECPSIKDFSKNMKHSVCSKYRRCNTSHMTHAEAQRSPKAILAEQIRGRGARRQIFV
jgi:hypothetical protein